MRIHVFGLGVISCIGKGIEENFNSLLAGRHGITGSSEDTDPFVEGYPVGRVKLSNDELAKLTGGGRKWPRAALLSLYAAHEAIQNIPVFNDLKTGFFSATTVGGMDYSEKGYAGWQRSGVPDPRGFINHECGKITELVADKLGINGFATTINTACSSSANSIILASRLIQKGVVDIALAGGTDAITAFTMNGFITLLIYDQQLCRPFDAARAGLNLGEGAGYLLLVSDKVAGKIYRDPLCEIAGFANANDAFHQTASSSEGIGSYLAMSNAVSMGGISVSDVDYINLHGTGTENNDASEATALKRLFNERIPPHSSTKSFTGHTLGASGGIEAVYTVLAINRSTLFPNIRFSSVIPEIDSSPLTMLTNKEIKYALSNSFGFGGNCTSLLFKKPVCSMHSVQQ